MFGGKIQKTGLKRNQYQEKLFNREGGTKIDR
jgi:hypothetical protein